MKSRFGITHAAAPPTSSLPTSLVLPFGWYQPERTLELRVQGAILRIILGGLAERGSDYERATFSAAG